MSLYIYCIITDGDQWSSMALAASRIRLQLEFICDPSKALLHFKCETRARALKGKFSESLWSLIS